MSFIVCCPLLNQENNRTKFFPKQKDGNIAPGAKAGDYQQINAGAVKTVYKRVQEGESETLTLDSSRVLYVAHTCLGRRELYEEVAIALDVEAALRRRDSHSSELYIQTDLQIREDGLGVDAPAAIEDLENHIRNKNISLETRLDFAYQVIVGMHNIQKAGYVTGDAKPENILMFKTSDGRLIARISDFGKAKKLSRDEFCLVVGNPRFAAPEGTLSYQAEVFSTALIVLRILEEGLHPKKCTELQMIVGDKVRRGIEGLLVREGRSNTVLERATLTCACISAKLSGSYSLERAYREERIIRHHIERLSDHYFTKDRSDSHIDHALLGIFGLLKDMTRADPRDRPLMQEVERRYKSAMDTPRDVPSISSKIDESSAELIQCDRLMPFILTPLSASGRVSRKKSPLHQQMK